MAKTEIGREPKQAVCSWYSVFIIHFLCLDSGKLVYQSTVLVSCWSPWQCKAERYNTNCQYR